MTNQCPSCGGNLRYDIPSGSLKCDHCDSLFPVETCQGNTGAEYHGGKNDKNYEVTMYTCPNCGAEISSMENAALDYCLYCGSFVTLDRQLSRLKKPDMIIPFSRTREDCQKAYRKMIARKLYAPKEFRKEEFLQTFRGIYIPYWSYRYEAGPEFRLSGEQEDRREGDYVYMQEYQMECRGTLQVSGMNYDASSTFDDAISGQIALTDEEKKRPFLPGYMFGFFGDTADVEAEVYQDDAAQMAGTTLWDALKGKKELKEGHPVKPSEKRKNKSDDGAEEEQTEEEKPSDLVNAMDLRKKTELTMLPVWFLTWRKGKKLAYSVVNGDTGEIYSEVPVDTGRYLLFSVLTAIPLFFLLNSAITFDCTSLLLLSMFLSCVFQVIYTTEVERIVRRTLHIDDKGYLARHQEQRERNEREYEENFLGSVLRDIFEFFFEDGILGFVLACSVGFAFFGFLMIGLVILCIAAPFYCMFRIIKSSRLLGEPGIVIDMGIAVLALVFSLVILLKDPAGDILYYGAAALCMLTIAFTAVRVLMRYNDVITRPVPHFFERKEGGQE